MNNFFKKRITGRQHSAGSTQSTSKLISASGSFIEDHPIPTSSPTQETRSNNNSSSFGRKILNNFRSSPKTRLAPPIPPPRRNASPKQRPSTEASIVELEIKLRELSGSVDPVTSARSIVASDKSAIEPSTSNFDAELRHLSPNTRLMVTADLNANGTWRRLAGKLRHPDRPDEELFNVSDVQLLAQAASPSEEILKTWSTMGRNRPRIRDLYDVLVSILQLWIAEQLMLHVTGKFVPLRPDDESDMLALSSDKYASRSSTNSRVNFSNLKACLSNVYQICYNTVEDATDHFSPRSGTKIAEGTYGVVYKVKIDGKDMAVKLFKDDIEQIANEIKQLSIFDHPNVLPLYGVAVGDESLCMITRFMDNGSLQQTLANQILDWPLRFRILRDVAAGLAYVHSLNVIHRDIKPANILLDENMNALIADFGLARQKKSFVTSKTNFAAGTGVYMAPECYVGYLTLFVDVYSFGVVALEVFTGLPILDNDREERVLTYHVREKTSEEVCDLRLNQLPTDIRDECYEWIQKCLKEKGRPDMKCLHERFQCFFDLVSA